MRLGCVSVDEMLSQLSPRQLDEWAAAWRLLQELQDEGSVTASRDYMERLTG